MRNGSRSQTDQGEVLDDYCHVTSAPGTLRSEGHVITFTHQKNQDFGGIFGFYRRLFGKESFVATRAN